MTVAPQMHSAESAPLRLRVGGPALQRDDGCGCGGRLPPFNVIPAQAGTHASLRLRSGASEAKPAEIWVLGTSPRMTVEYATAVANANGREGVR